MSKKKYWIVCLRFRSGRSLPVYRMFLNCQNSRSYRRRRTRTGRRVPRRWRIVNCRMFAFSFESLKEAKIALSCSLIKKQSKRPHFDGVEILECVGEPNRTNFRSRVVYGNQDSALKQLAEALDEF